MSDNVISKIRDAEEMAKEKINSAKIEAKRLVEKAKKDSASSYSGVLKKTQDEADEILNNAREEGNKLAMPIVEKANEEAEKILNIDTKKLSELADSIVERIVIDNGNS